MKRYLIGTRTVTTVWVTARSEREASKSLYEATRFMDLRFEIGDDVPIQMVNFTIQARPEVIGEEDED